MPSEPSTNATNRAVEAAMTERDIKDIMDGLKKLGERVDALGEGLGKKIDDLGACIAEVTTDVEVLKVRVETDEKEIAGLRTVSTGWNALNSILAFAAGLVIMLQRGQP